MSEVCAARRKGRVQHELQGGGRRRKNTGENLVLRSASQKLGVVEGL